MSTTICEGSLSTLSVPPLTAIEWVSDTPGSSPNPLSLTTNTVVTPCPENNQTGTIVTVSGNTISVDVPDLGGSGETIYAFEGAFSITSTSRFIAIPAQITVVASINGIAVQSFIFLSQPILANVTVPNGALLELQFFWFNGGLDVTNTGVMKAGSTFGLIQALTMIYPPTLLPILDKVQKRFRRLLQRRFRSLRRD
jgi:hypothetical protein